VQPNTVTSQYEKSEGAGISVDMVVFNVKLKNLQMHYILLRNGILFASFQSSAMLWVRSLLLWDAMQYEGTTTILCCVTSKKNEGLRVFI